VHVTTENLQFLSGCKNNYVHVTVIHIRSKQFANHPLYYVSTKLQGTKMQIRLDAQMKSM
jgi:hypothetical protein